MNNIQRLQYELAQTEERATELKRLLKSIQEEEQNSTKPIFINEFSIQDKSLNGLILHLTIQWLDTKDTLSCAKVSRRWRGEIDRPVTWKRLATQTAPGFLHDLEARSISPNFNYKGIAKGLAWKPSVFFRPATFKGFPEPKLSAHDLFLVVEAKDKLTGTILGSWHDHFGNLQNLEEGYRNKFPSITLMKQKEHGGFLPSMPRNFKNLDDEDMLNWVYYNTIFTFRYFRCDTGQSVCLGFDMGYQERIFGNGTEHDKAVVCLEYTRPETTGIPADIARRVWEERDYSRIRMEMWYRIEKQNGSNNYFAIKGIKCNFLAFNMEREAQKFVSQKEFLLCLEALDWR